MKILFTNLHLANYTGTEVYVKELSLALKQRNFDIQIYSTVLGKLSKEIMDGGVFVTNSLDKLQVPDIIHAHHYNQTLDVINKFKETPAIFFCHSGTISDERPPNHENIKKYVAVDDFCLENILNHGISIDKTQVIYNWVNTDRYNQKKNINNEPKNALIFSNYTAKNNFYRAINIACKNTGIEVHAIGRDLRETVRNPEAILGNYDIVFAKAKCAMEAMACGCAVIICDYPGLGEMVTPENFDYARKYNFGFKNMSRPHNVDLITNEIKKYNADNIKIVSDKIRIENDFKKSLDEIINLYNNIGYK